MRRPYTIALIFLIFTACFQSIDELRFGEVRNIPIDVKLIPEGSPGSIMLDSGEWLMFFKAKEEIPQPGDNLLVARSSDFGHSWSQPDTIVKTTLNCGDPYVKQLRDGLIVVNFALFQSRKNNRDLRSTGCFMVRSFDNGEHFTAPRFIATEGYRYVVPSDNLIELKNGILILPAFGENQNGSISAIILVSSDRGENFDQVTEIGVSSSRQVQLGHVSIVQLSDHTLLCILEEDGHLLQTLSHDDGMTWGPLKYSGVLGGKPDLLLTNEGILICVFQDFWPYGLSYVKSYDHGETWEKEKSLLRVEQKSEIRPTLLSLGHQKSGVCYATEQNIMAIVFKETRLPPPKGFSLSNQPGDHVSLRWNQVEGASYYIIYRNQNPHFKVQSGYPFEGNSLIGLTGTQYVDTLVDSGKTYYYRVSAVAGTGRLVPGTGNESVATAPLGITLK